jgi:hypothetical protein
MKARTKNLSRRNFLLTVGAGSAVAAATVVANRKPPAPQRATGNDKRATQGYQESGHVNNYYRTTKV